VGILRNLFFGNRYFAPSIGYENTFSGEVYRFQKTVESCIFKEEKSIDKQKILGTVGGVVVTADVKEYALGQGLYVMEPSGVSFNITPPNGQPKEW